MPEKFANQPVPLVSVIIPTYNRAQILPITLNAILKQTYRHMEIIVVSDGSTDQTAQVVRRYQDNDPRVRYLEITHTGRPAPARNHGIKKAHGEFLAFCDDDDIWLPEKIERQVAKMQEQPTAGLCYTYRITQTGNREYVFPYKFREGNLFRTLFMATNFITNSSVLIRKAALCRVGLFDESPRLKAIEDFDLWLRIARHFPLVCIPAPMVKCQYDAGGVWHKNPLNILKYYFYYRRDTSLWLFIVKLLYFPFNRLFMRLHNIIVLTLKKRIS